MLEGAEEEETVLLGDLNVDFLRKTIYSYRHLLDAILFPLNLSSYIDSAARFSTHGSSSFDTVLSNTERLQSGSFLNTNFSDHCLVTAVYEHTEPSKIHPSRTRVRRDLHHLNVNKNAALLHSAGLSEFNHEDVDSTWREWHTKFIEAPDEAVP